MNKMLFFSHFPHVCFLRDNIFISITMIQAWMCELSNAKGMHKRSEAFFNKGDVHKCHVVDILLKKKKNTTWKHVQKSYITPEIEDILNFPILSIRILVLFNLI